MTKKTRRAPDQMLTDSIAELHVQISRRINEVKDKRIAIDEVFEALHPLRVLEDEYRNHS